MVNIRSSSSSKRFLILQPGSYVQGPCSKFLSGGMGEGGCWVKEERVEEIRGRGHTAVKCLSMREKLQEHRTAFVLGKYQISVA